MCNARRIYTPKARDNFLGEGNYKLQAVTKYIKPKE